MANQIMFKINYKTLCFINIKPHPHYEKQQSQSKSTASSANSK